jgi:tetratricopeptide (TPR) repeat protein
VARWAFAKVLRLGLVCTIGLSTESAIAQRSLPPSEQARLESKAREAADATAAFARQWLGNMHPAGEAAFRNWLLAARAWQKASGGAAAFLAEGVLFDCLDRTTYLHSQLTSGLAVDARLQDLGLPRRDRAVKAFAAALRSEPTLAEARFRSARIRALDNAQGRTDLERIANSDDAQFGYLAAITRASIAHQRDEVAIATRWYERALAIRGTSTAAEIGLIALRLGTTLRTDRLDGKDPYYTYPCRILTPSVEAEFAKRLAGVPR